MAKESDKSSKENLQVFHSVAALDALSLTTMSWWRIVIEERTIYVSVKRKKNH